jgi:site-specific DNA-cytosine methylase
VPAIAYSFDALSSNSMKSSNPNSGCREVEISRTIDTMALNPSANQGGIAVANETTVRRLTPTECERLQGFPDGWTEGQADSNRYKQMGNAVAVPVVEWIVKNLVQELQ